jgi:hypothetical protein
MMKRYSISFQKDIKQSVHLAEHILMIIEAESNREARRKFNENISITETKL